MNPPVTQTDKNGLTEARTRYGHRMLVDAGDLIGRRVLAKGVFDGVSLALMTALLQQIGARTVLDIGANIGNHSLAFSRFCQRVIAFEPGHRNFSLLQRNAEVNPGVALQALNFGLSSTNSTATLHLDSRNYGGASLTASNGPAALTEQVQLRIGDEWVATNGIDDIDAIKIDVEGHEIEVLKGLTETIRRCRPLLFMEWNSAEVRRRFVEEELLQSLFPGYAVRAVEHNLSKQYWRQQPLGQLRRRLRCWFAPKRAFLTEFDPASTYSNIVLIPQERMNLLRTATRPPLWGAGN